ncbi:NucA/NucB deoxyribonuclease domain-containing protein [Asanoa sp. NPDC050611]|uniref:NucA/NucB deoxyribonuclease domain-containing protein n=1 Tax=Asanoa sp. NPDC050611 TaxID=3157098 RepID=UPI0033C8A66C
MDLTVVGYGRDDGQRNVRLFVRPNEVAFAKSYTPTTKFGLDIVCLTNISSCQEPDDHNLTMAQWLALRVSRDWISFTLSSDETEGLGPEKVLWHDFAIEAEYFDGVSEFNGDYGIRCDSATYIPNAAKACIFYDVIPHLQYWILNADGTNSGHKAVAEHIRQAQDQPNTTWPPKLDGSNKVIPGKYTGESSAFTWLERVSSGSDRYKENGTVKDYWCSFLEREGDNQCDEYPFASTWQGAGLGDGNFSVKYVPQPDNSSAGGSLVQYYNRDRILYTPYDFFYVQVLDRQGQGGNSDGPPIVSAGPEIDGDEGSALRLYGSVRDSSPGLQIQWTATPVENVDPGTSCVFSDATIPQPTITCNDDGLFLAELTVNDGVNPAARASTLVTVHNVSPAVRITEPTAWQLFRVNGPIVFNTPFTDPGTNDTHFCQYNFDQGFSDPAFRPSVPNNCGLVKGYDHAGMYTVTASVTDDDTGQDDTSVMIVVYDPHEGSATITGTTATPPGAVVGNPTATGATHLVYNAQYPLGGSRPYDPELNGQALSWVDGIPFRLQLVAMEWLVITEDGNVAGRGTGTVNGQTGYTWVLYGWDSCDGANSPGCQNVPTDKVRLVIFETATGQVVYDHSPGSREYDVDRISPTELTSGAVRVRRWPRN